MEIEKYECIVLRSVNYKDNDKIISLFSKDIGLITAQARGAKRVKSSFLNTTQLFSYGQYELTKTKDRYYLSNVYIIHDFGYIRNDYNKYIAACVMSELTEIILKHTQDYKNLYTLYINCLFYMQNTTWERCLAYFFVRITEILGIIPSLDYCTNCGQSITNMESIYWSHGDGGVVCNICKKATKIENSTLLSLKEIFSILPEKISLITDENLNAFISFMYKYINIQSDIALKTAKYINCNDNKDIV